MCSCDHHAEDPTRYRPRHYDAIMDGEYEAFIDGFVNDQPGHASSFWRPSSPNRTSKSATV
jgi:hypothetical protein